MATRGRTTGGALDAIGAAIDRAADAPDFADPGDAQPFGGRDDDDVQDAKPFPPGCPIVPLGVMGQVCFYLDYNGQVLGLEAGNKHGKGNLALLFGPRLGWLEKHFPQWSKPVRERDPTAAGGWVIVEESKIIGFDQKLASEALILECARKGIFNPAGRIRGAGAHRIDGGGLALHCGDMVMRLPIRIDGRPGEIEWHRPGFFGEHVYTAADRIPRPHHARVGEGEGRRLLEIIRRWYWKRPQLDPLLVLGGVGASLIGGALDWRANVWITGGKGTGKSTLNGKRGLFDQMLGRGLVRSADPSAAYLRQRLRNSTVPVFLDELEAERDDRRTRQILELARVSSSGDDAGRGGADHQATEFTLQSAFWASSILIPPMEPQDRSRWAICQLRPIPADARRLDLRAERLGELGPKLLRRMIDGWHRWDETLAAYQGALQAMGHSARACDQFGTLLAAGDLLLNDVLSDDETIAAVASLCDPRSLRETAEGAEEHELCLNHLRTSMVQSRGGDERESVGTWIGKAVQEICDPGLGGGGKDHRRLQELGLKIVHRTETGAKAWEPGQRGFLAVANSHQAIAGVFAKEKWAGGVWSQALGYTPGAVEGVKVKFGRLSLTACLVPLEAAIDESEIPEGARWAVETREGGGNA